MKNLRSFLLGAFLLAAVFVGGYSAGQPKLDPQCVFPDGVLEELEKREIAGLSLGYERDTGYTCLVYVEYRDGREVCVLP